MKFTLWTVAVLITCLAELPLNAAPKASGSRAMQAGSARAEVNELLDPIVFKSARGELNILMIAKPKNVELAGLEPTAWLYEICLRKDAVGDACPAGSAKTANPYGGVRLALQSGDHLRIRLVNQLA